MLLWPFLSAPSRCTLVSPIVDSRFPGVTSGSPCHAPGLVVTRRGLCLMGHWPPIVVSPIVDSRFPGVTSGSPCHAPGLVVTRRGLCLMGHWPPIVVSRFLGVTSGSPCHAPRLVNTRSGQSAWYLVVTWHSARDHF